MDYQSKYLKYKNKYLELKKIMNQNQIGGTNFFGLGDNKEEKEKQIPNELPPLDVTQRGVVRKDGPGAPRLPFKKQQQQQFFPNSQQPIPQQRNEITGDATRPKDEQVFFPESEKSTSPIPEPLDLTQIGNKSEDGPEATRPDAPGPDASRLGAPRPTDDEQVFFPESTSPRPAPKDEKKKPIIKSAIDFLMAPFTTESDEEDKKKKVPENFRREKN